MNRQINGYGTRRPNPDSTGHAPQEAERGRRRNRPANPTNPASGPTLRGAAPSAHHHHPSRRSGPEPDEIREGGGAEAETQAQLSYTMERWLSEPPAHEFWSLHSLSRANATANSQNSVAYASAADNDPTGDEANVDPVAEIHAAIAGGASYSVNEGVGAAPLALRDRTNNAYGDLEGGGNTWMGLGPGPPFI